MIMVAEPASGTDGKIELSNGVIGVKDRRTRVDTKSFADLPVHVAGGEADTQAPDGSAFPESVQTRFT